MVRIRLSRTGKKRQASYRVVVADSKSPRDGRVVERIGFYNPMPNPAEYRIDEERALHWLNVGAQPSDAVRRLLEKQGTYDRLTRLRAGESFDNLVAEFTGVTAEPATEGEEAAKAGVVTTAAAVATKAVETVTETAETVSAAAMAAVAELVGRDEEK
ncbi:MAG: 30S ribosomal protein S16 [Chloroflexota bacterium]